MNDSTLLKVCSDCGKSLPADRAHFAGNKTAKSGLAARCLPCAAIYAAAYYQANKARHLAQSAQWRVENREKSRASSKAHYWENREKDLLRQKARRLEKREEIREEKRLQHLANPQIARDRTRRWALANPERAKLNGKASVARRRARQKSAEGTYNASDLRNQLSAQNGKCYYCKCKVGQNFHADHLIPLSKGGSNLPNNIVIACPTCNLSKSSKMPWDFAGRLL